MEKIAHLRYAENDEAILQTLSEHSHRVAGNSNTLRPAL